MNIKKLDTGNYISSSDFREDHPELFRNHIFSVGFEGVPSSEISLYRYDNRTLVLGHSESWTVGYKHPRGYGCLYGLWEIDENITEESSDDEFIHYLYGIVSKEVEKYKRWEFSLFKDWNELPSYLKHEIKNKLYKQRHIDSPTLKEANREYTGHKSFWGQHFNAWK